MTPRSPSAILAAYLKRNGAIPAVRVSSASARGRAGQYSYWGATRYEVCVGRSGAPVYRALEAARSDRRSKRLADADARELAAREGRLFLALDPGRLSESETLTVLEALHHPRLAEARRWLEAWRALQTLAARSGR